MARIFAYLTGERHTPESVEHGDAAERGWIDPWWSHNALFDSRNDVRPVVDVWEDDEELGDLVADALDLLGAWESSDGSTFYGIDPWDEDYRTGEHWQAALHFVRKSYDATVGRYVEEPYAPELPARV